VVIEVDTDVVRPRAPDLGRMEVTGNSADRWRYRTPTLRNIALTAPYMHNGSLADLRAVIEYYNLGGAPHAGQDARIRPLHLDAAAQDDLLAFLKALSGSNAAALAQDARSTTIGDR
jgi:cytochrome c peroxidase